MKLIVAGSRTFDNQRLASEYIGNICLVEDCKEIVSGGANGADSIGELEALNRGIKVVKFLPDWDIHGKAAGPIRNRQMAEYADAALVFWDTKSKGSADMIKQMLKLHKPVLIVPFK